MPYRMAAHNLQKDLDHEVLLENNQQVLIYLKMQIEAIIKHKTVSLVLGDYSMAEWEDVKVVITYLLAIDVLDMVTLMAHLMRLARLPQQYRVDFTSQEDNWQCALLRKLNERRDVVNRKAQEDAWQEKQEG